MFPPHGSAPQMHAPPQPAPPGSAPQAGQHPIAQMLQALMAAHAAKMQGGGMPPMAGAPVQQMPSGGPVPAHGHPSPFMR